MSLQEGESSELPLSGNFSRHTLQVTPEFRRALPAGVLQSLDAESATVIGLSSDGRIALLNSRWFAFAHENHGEEVLRRFGLGTLFLDGISGPLRGYYARVLQRVLEEAKPWELTYSCHSSELSRRYRLHARPLGRHGLLLTHSLVMSSPIEERRTGVDSGARYRDEQAFIHACGNCRRVRTPGDREVWQWVPELIGNPPNDVSHGMCSACYSEYSASVDLLEG